MTPQIAPSARRHGIDDQDILHAYRNAFRVFEEDGAVMRIGADRSGRILEVLVVTRDRRRRIVHAMRARAKYLRGEEYLRREER